VIAINLGRLPRNAAVSRILDQQPSAFLYFDLFFFLFLAGDGVPNVFRLDQLYGKYYELLTCAIQQASSGLVSAKASKWN
jgi:hypothetical protein